MTDSNRIVDVDFGCNVNPDIAAARERFLDVCREWADGLIEDGATVRRSSGVAALSNLESLAAWVPHVAHIGEEYGGTFRVSVTDLPPSQLRVWQAGYQLIVDTCRATPDQVQVPQVAAKVDGIYTLVTRDVFVDEHRHCGCSIRIDWDGRKVVCGQHLVCAMFVDT